MRQGKYYKNCVDWIKKVNHNEGGALKFWKKVNLKLNNFYIFYIKLFIMSF